MKKKGKYATQITHTRQIYVKEWSSRIEKYIKTTSKSGLTYPCTKHSSQTTKLIKKIKQYTTKGCIDINNYST